MLNSDATDYAGSGMGNGARILAAENRTWMNRPYSLEVTLPPLAGILLKLASAEEQASGDNAARQSTGA